MKTLGTGILAFAVHLALGWPWTFAAGLVGGYWAGRGGWRVGAVGVGLDWAGLIAYNYIAAPEAVPTMVDTVGQVLGNMPGAAVVACTLCLGLMLGALGGATGSSLRQASEAYAGRLTTTTT